MTDLPFLDRKPPFTPAGFAAAWGQALLMSKSDRLLIAEQLNRSAIEVIEFYFSFESDAEQANLARLRGVGHHVLVQVAGPVIEEMGKDAPGNVHLFFGAIKSGPPHIMPMSCNCCEAVPERR